MPRTGSIGRRRSVPLRTRRPLGNDPSGLEVHHAVDDHGLPFHLEPGLAVALVVEVELPSLPFGRLARDPYRAVAVLQDPVLLVARAFRGQVAEQVAPPELA